MQNLQADQAQGGMGHLGPETLLHGFASRRGHKRSYRRWTGMLRGRVCPSIEDLEPASIAGPGDMLIDLRSAEGDPQLVCIGGALVHDCGKKGMRRLSEVPPGSFLSLLAAHYRHVAASREPIAFEGEREGPDGLTAYTAILLPLSSDGQNVDFIYGSIGWLEPADDALAAEIERDLRSLPAPGAVSAKSLWPAA